jgi:hypothetical protein
MRTRQKFVTSIASFLLPCIVLLVSTTSEAQKKRKYVCDEAQPESMCTAANTCGSASAPCTVDITKAGNILP